MRQLNEIRKEKRKMVNSKKKLGPIEYLKCNEKEHTFISMTRPQEMMTWTTTLDRKNHDYISCMTFVPDEAKSSQVFQK